MKSAIVTFNEKPPMLMDRYDEAVKNYSILFEPTKKGTNIGLMTLGNLT